MHVIARRDGGTPITETEPSTYPTQGKPPSKEGGAASTAAEHGGKSHRSLRTQLFRFPSSHLSENPSSSLPAPRASSSPVTTIGQQSKQLHLPNVPSRDIPALISHCMVFRQQSRYNLEKRPSSHPGSDRGHVMARLCRVTDPTSLPPSIPIHCFSGHRERERSAV
ncbi:hypothetical protein VTI74DRAFT_5257 [Chaetomium olivicolor]